MYNKNDSLVKNYFHIELESDEGEKFKYDIYQPKISTIRKLKSIDKSEGIEVFDYMLDILSEAISHNKDKKVVSADFLASMLDTEDISNLFDDYFQWVNDLKKK